MNIASLQVIKAAGGGVPADFRCKKPEFAEYLDANAAYDQQHKMGRTYWAVHRNRVVGYMTLAMGSAGKERQVDLSIDTHGPIPALSLLT